jgi:hypothetical protein
MYWHVHAHLDRGHAYCIGMLIQIGGMHGHAQIGRELARDAQVGR